MAKNAPKAKKAPAKKAAAPAKKTAKPIPDGFHAITPYLTLKDTSAAIEFYKKAFGAVELFRMAAPDGKVGHAEIKIGDSIVMMSDEFEGMTAAPSGIPPVMMHLYVTDSDSVFNQAVAAGAKVLRPIADQFYGDRNGTVEDPFGHRWGISTHKKDMSMEEIQKAHEAMAAHAGT
jgi:PhnB protein